jgi:2,4-dienoyl-CoA reductase-like NADH-dependent reductase (Old Yellow Enzyme family)
MNTGSRSTRNLASAYRDIQLELRALVNEPPRKIPAIAGKDQKSCRTYETREARKSSGEAGDHGQGHAGGREGAGRQNPCYGNGEADLIAFGTAFLANPDLPQRYRSKAPLNVPDQATFYAGEDKGLTDYPPLA